MVSVGIDVGFRGFLECKTTVLQRADDMTLGFGGYQNVVREVRRDKEERTVIFQKHT